MKKGAYICIMLILPIVSLQAEEFGDGGFSLLLNGGIVRNGQIGSESSYQLGINHFPLIPAETRLCYGGGFIFRLYRNFSLTLGAKYSPSQDIICKDPKDGDELTYKQPGSILSSLSLVLNLNTSRLQPYLILGGGMKFTSNRPEANLVTKYGYDVLLEAHQKKYSALIIAGGGLKLFLFRWIAIYIEATFVKLLKGQPDSILLSAGLLATTD